MYTLNKALLLLTMSVLGAGVTQARATSTTVVPAAEGMTRAQVKEDRDGLLRGQPRDVATGTWTVRPAATVRP